MGRGGDMKRAVVGLGVVGVTRVAGILTVAEVVVGLRVEDRRNVVERGRGVRQGSLSTTLTARMIVSP